jgi:hypothetical protein
MGNLGLPYKSGIGSALKLGTANFELADKSYTSKTFYQFYSPRISGVNSTVLSNESFIWTYSILTELSAGDGATIGPYPIYRSNEYNINKMQMIFYYENLNYFFINFVARDDAATSPTYAVKISPIPINVVQKNTKYQYVLYKNEQPFTSNTAYRLYVNGINIPIAVDINTASVRTPLITTSSLTFNNIMFGGNPAGLFYRNGGPMYVFNNSVFKLDSGLTTTYIDNLATELHRVENYIHLLPTSYTINPSNVVYYFPLYLKEGKDIRDYYKPTKKFDVTLVLGYSSTIPLPTFKADFVSTGSTNYLAGQPTQSASLYKGPHNIWRKPYPPYDPYI